MSTCYSAPSRFLLRGAPDYNADNDSEFHAEEHEQLRVKDLPRIPMRRLMPVIFRYFQLILSKLQ